MSIDGLLADLEEFREEHDRLTRSERRAREGNEILKAENAELRERPVDLKRVQAQVRALLSDLALAQRETRVMTAERDDAVARLQRRREKFDAERERFSADAVAEAQQTRRKLAVALDVNTRLSAQVAELQDRVSRAEQRVEDSRRALLDHAGRA